MGIYLENGVELESVTDNFIGGICLFNILNDTDFVEWVSRLYKQTKMYGDYLSFLDINLSDETAIEINKGKYDSLGLKLVAVVSSFGIIGLITRHTK